MTEFDLEKLSDEELVSLARRNQENFFYLMKRYQNRLLVYIRRLSNFDQDQAEDVLQETFIKTYYNLNDFDQSLKFSSWIYRICHNQLIDAYRRSKARPQNINWEDGLDVIKGLVSEADPAADLDRKYKQGEINKAIAALELKYREVLFLKFFEDRDYKEMSDILKKHMGTIASLLNRAKQKLEEKLKENKNI